MNSKSNWLKEKKSICSVAQALHSKNMLASADGNISIRLNKTTILITPSGISKARMTVNASFGLVTIDGNLLRGQPSTELAMHLSIYKNVPEAMAVVHAHPPTAIAWTLAKPDLTELPCDSMSELILALGSLPIVPYARPGTQNMGDVLKSYLPQNRALILARHGALTWGQNLEEAHRGMERIEHAAQILLHAEQLGGAQPLSFEEVTFLKSKRKQIGTLSL